MRERCCEEGVGCRCFCVFLWDIIIFLKSYFLRKVYRLFCDYLRYKEWKKRVYLEEISFGLF